MPPAPNNSLTQLPVICRERTSVDLRTLVRRLHIEDANREDRPVNPREVDYRTIFTLAGEGTERLVRVMI